MASTFEPAPRGTADTWQRLQIARADVAMAYFAAEAAVGDLHEAHERFAAGHAPALSLEKRLADLMFARKDLDKRTAAEKLALEEWIAEVDGDLASATSLALIDAADRMYARDAAEHAARGETGGPL